MSGTSGVVALQLIFHHRDHKWQSLPTDWLMDAISYLARTRLQYTGSTVNSIEGNPFCGDTIYREPITFECLLHTGRWTN